MTGFRIPKKEVTFAEEMTGRSFFSPSMNHKNKATMTVYNAPQCKIFELSSEEPMLGVSDLHNEVGNGQLAHPKETWSASDWSEQEKKS